MADFKSLKDAKTFEEQLKTLEKRGLIVEDREEALDALRSLNYYRLRGYYIHLCSNDVFIPGTTFSTLQRLHDFDAALRALILELVFPIEIKLRTQVAYELGHFCGPDGYLYYTNFVNSDYHQTFLDKAKSEASQSKERFIDHHRQFYNGILPVWALVEVLPFGVLSKLYSNMMQECRTRVAEYFNAYDEKLLVNWMHILSLLRNICAHQARLFRRSLSATAIIYESDSMRLSMMFPKFKIYPNTVFATLLILKRLSDNNNWDRFLGQFNPLMDAYADVVKPTDIGMPIGWKNAFT